MTFRYIAFMSIYGFTFAEFLTSELTLISAKQNEPATNTYLLYADLEYKHRTVCYIIKYTNAERQNKTPAIKKHRT